MYVQGMCAHVSVFATYMLVRDVLQSIHRDI